MHKEHPLLPALFSSFRQGYSRSLFMKDLVAGIGVGIIALPLAMAFAIASGVSPKEGLYTAVVAGFLTSLLSGSPVQIGGPTGAFIVVVAATVQNHGIDGLALATLMSSSLLVLLGMLRAGRLIETVKEPVIVGFTAGIALIIVSSQLKDFGGLTGSSWLEHYNPYALALSSFSLLLILALKRFLPKAPGYL